MKRLTTLRAALALLAALACMATAWAARTVTMLVPFSAGGTVDIVARQLGPSLSRELGQTVIVENRSGAGGTIASALLARAAPDGSTLMLMHIGATFNPALYDRLPFDTAKDLVPVALIGDTPNALVVTRALPVRTVGELVAYVKAHPGELSYASGGVGSASHVAMESLMTAVGIRMTHIPYKGGGAALKDLIGGEVQVMLQSIASLKSAIDNGQLRVLATSGLRRSAALPTVPTLDEQGVKGFEFAPWYGVFAPPGMSAEQLDRIHDAIGASIRDPENAKALALQGIDITERSRAQFAEQFRADLGRWGQVIRDLHIKGE